MTCCLTKRLTKEKSEGKDSRIGEVDFFRGLAILMMIVYHFMWDMDYFGIRSIDLYHGFWKLFQVLTGGLFIFLAGISLTLKYSKKGHGGYPREFLKRGIMIFACGLIITAGSLLFARDSFVFFGILHFIGLSIMIATFFVQYRLLNLFLGVFSIILGVCLQKITLSFPWLVWLGFNYPVSTLDLYPLFPWIGLVFLGMFLGSMIYPEGKRIAAIGKGSAGCCPMIRKISQPVQFLGRYSLLIYLMHLPVVFAAAYLVSVFV